MTRITKSLSHGLLILVLVSVAGCRLPQRFQPAPEENAPPAGPHTVPVMSTEEVLEPTAIRPTPTPIATAQKVEDTPPATAPPAASSADGWDAIRVGMTQAEVEAHIGIANAEISRGSHSVVYRWDNVEKNATGLGKFKDAKLILWRVRDKPRAAEPIVAPTPVVAGAYPENEVLPDPVVQRERTETRSRAGESIVPLPPRRKVSIAGSSRRERRMEKSGASNQSGAYQPKVRLPEFTYGLQDGSYIFRILNNGESTAQVGLRSGKEGKDLSVASGEEVSIRVQRGDFNFYYIFDGVPYTRYETSRIELDGDTAIVQDITLQEKGYVLGGVEQEAKATN